MENVTDALHIAFGVLAFVLALSVSIMAFGQVRLAAEGILNSTDRETSYSYMAYDASKTTREVTAVDIVPTLYRAYKENYIVKFEKLSSKYSSEYLYAVKQDIKNPEGKVIRKAVCRYSYNRFRGTNNKKPRRCYQIYFSFT